jgi:hypothetical protein
MVDYVGINSEYQVRVISVQLGRWVYAWNTRLLCSFSDFFCRPTDQTEKTISMLPILSPILEIDEGVVPCYMPRSDNSSTNKLDVCFFNV